MCLRITDLEAVAVPQFSWFKSLVVKFQDNDITVADCLGKLITSSINHWVVQLICEETMGEQRGKNCV